MSDYKRSWLFALGIYGLGLGSYLIANPEDLSSGDWVFPLFLFIVPALLLAYILNAIVEIWNGFSVTSKMEPEGKWTTAARIRNCYCGVWDKNPTTYEKQGYAPGYCGTCDRCGAAGHTRHFPVPAPYTGAWCDRCYRVLAWTWPFRSVSGWLYILAIAAIAYAIGRPLIAAVGGALG